MSKPSRQWDIKGSKEILDNYKKPNENVDIGNVYYAATQLEAAYDRLAEENKILREAIKNMQGILSPNRKGHHVSGCETRAIDVGFTALARVEVLE